MSGAAGRGHTKFIGWVEEKGKKSHVGIQALSIPVSVSSAAASPYLLLLGLFCRKFSSSSNQRNQAEDADSLRKHCCSEREWGASRRER